MSGIAGIVQFCGTSVEEGEVRKMTCAMDYRGPDGNGQWTSGPAVLAQCTFCTTEESVQQIQPLLDEAGNLVIVMDGRVDNYDELRDQLLRRGACLRNRSDIELVLQAYKLWGRDCLAHLDGDYAIAIWNAEQKTLFCARDRFGHKPFYYWRNGDQFVFASDFHAILAVAGSPRKVNAAMVAEHLCVYPASLDETLIEGIYRLPPAHFLLRSGARLEVAAYWSIGCSGDDAHRPEAEYVEQFLDLLRGAVKRQTRTLGAAGIYLSGGLDSSSILCTAARPFGASAKLAAFSLSFEGTPAADEAAYIKAASQQAGIQGHVVPYQPVAFDHIADRIARFKDIGESPNGEMLNRIRSAARDQGVRVLLTGMGGDEWFAKSNFYMAELLKNGDVRGLAGEFFQGLERGISMPAMLNLFLYRGISPLVPEPLHRPIRFGRRLLSRKPALAEGGFVHPDLATKVCLEERLKARPKCPPSVGPAARSLYQRLHMGSIVRSREVDSRGLGVSRIEERHPFYDRQLVEYAFSLPESLRSRGPGKYVMREAMRGILPESIRTRVDKADFSHVIADTLMEAGVAEWLKCRHLAAAGWVDVDRIRRQYSAFRHYYSQGQRQFMALSWEIWAVLTLEVWLSVLACN